jgi:hypothetical protein
VEDWIRIALVGIGATTAVDLWALARRRLLGVPLPDFGMLGRWLAHCLRGRFRHEKIAASAAVAHERLIGWTSHYLIGIAFAALLVAVAGIAWLRDPTLAPALAVGVATVVFPLFVMQPGMGAGIAGRRMPNPSAARIHSITTHAIFGLGLYAAAEILLFFLPA